MNTRCYRCGNSFSLSREVIEGAVAAAGPDDKVYVAFCPRCRTANKVPLQQLRRTLPTGWTPPVVAAAEAVPEVPAPAPEPTPAPTPEPEAAPAKPARKRASKTVEAKQESPAPEATPAAKKASRSKAKPSS